MPTVVAVTIYVCSLQFVVPHIVYIYVLITLEKISGRVHSRYVMARFLELLCRMQSDTNAFA